MPGLRYSRSDTLPQIALTLPLLIMSTRASRGSTNRTHGDKSQLNSPSGLLVEETLSVSRWIKIWGTPASILGVLISPYYALTYRTEVVYSTKKLPYRRGSRRASVALERVLEPRSLQAGYQCSRLSVAACMFNGVYSFVAIHVCKGCRTQHFYPGRAETTPAEIQVRGATNFRQYLHCSLWGITISLNTVETNLRPNADLIQCTDTRATSASEIRG